MTKVNRASPPEPSQEPISRLITAAYLQPALRHDAHATTRAIAQLREALRPGEKTRALRLPNRNGLTAGHRANTRVCCLIVSLIRGRWSMVAVKIARALSRSPPA
jgi:hypothetical protein